MESVVGLVLAAGGVLLFIVVALDSTEACSAVARARAHANGGGLYGCTRLSKRAFTMKQHRFFTYRLVLVRDVLNKTKICFSRFYRFW
jgi:hypothetical protein